jgi:site-specific recombinase XerD
VPVPGTEDTASETAILPLSTGGSDLSSFTSEEADRVRDYAAAARAENTVRAYRADWNDFVSWCRGKGVCPLPAPPEAVAVYLSERAETCKVSTLQRRLVAIAHFHKAAGLETPTDNGGVKSVWSGIRRVKGTAQEGKQPVLIEDLRAMVGTLNLRTPKGQRDRALLLLGFATASRRSELVALDVEDLRFNRDGLTVTVRESKTDQEGEGMRKGVPYGSNPDTCPVRGVQDYLRKLKLKEGPLFRRIDRWGNVAAERLSGEAVWRVVKCAAGACGLDPREFGGHSLRAGLVTQAARNGVEERVIMRQSGHKSVAMVRRYIREGELFRDNAAGRVGL